jgi:hypothetical protein
MEANACEFCGIEFDPSETMEEFRAGVRRPNTKSAHECEGMKPEYVEVGPKYFACVCRGKGRADCAWIQAEVRKILRIEEDKNWLTSIIYGLLEFDAEITGIWADQWSQVNAKSEDGFTTAIQCDTIEDGMAATYLCFYQRQQKQTETYKEKKNEQEKSEVTLEMENKIS